MVVSQAASVPTKNIRQHLSVRQVSKVLTGKATQVTILEDISFSVPHSSLFAISGPSGSGKSTLLNIITGVDRPSSGKILFNDVALLRMSENKLSRWRGSNVGIVFQFFQLLPTLTMQENVLLALELGGVIPRKERQERAKECLAMVGMADYSKRLPNEVSGGQQQRVAIARALANDPPVIVADEPTGNLDSKTAHQIFDLLASLTEQEKTVIYVTHDPNLTQRASGGIELLDGHIVNTSGSLS